jgi:hypothetical protein
MRITNHNKLFIKPNKYINAASKVIKNYLLNYEYEILIL